MLRAWQTSSRQQWRPRQGCPWTPSAVADCLICYLLPAAACIRHVCSASAWQHVDTAEQYHMQSLQGTLAQVSLLQVRVLSHWQRWRTATVLSSKLHMTNSCRVTFVLLSLVLCPTMQCNGLVGAYSMLQGRTLLVWLVLACFCQPWP